MQIIILALLFGAANAVDCSTTGGSASCAAADNMAANTNNADCAADPCTAADHRLCCTPSDGFWINAAGAAEADTALSACTGKTGTTARLVAATDIADATCTGCVVGTSFGPVDGSADCAAVTTPSCGYQAAVGDAAAATRLKAATATTDAACDACASGTSAAADTDNCAAASSTPTYGDCTAAEATTMAECATKVLEEVTKSTATDYATMCSLYQKLNECYPACYCKITEFKDAMAASNKQLTDSLANAEIVCPLTCGVGPAPAAPAPTSTSGSLYGDCTADEATAMMDCSTKIQEDTPSEDLADMDKLCGIYQSMNACYPPCFCEDADFKEIMDAQNKETTETLATVDIKCTLACGASLNAANPLTIGFTSVALIVAALFATL